MLQIPVDQLNAYIDSRVDEKFNERIAALPKSDEPLPAFQNQKQACKFIDVSEPTLRKIEREGGIKACEPTPGRKLYATADLIGYMLSTKK